MVYWSLHIPVWNLMNWASTVCTSISMQVFWTPTMPINLCLRPPRGIPSLLSHLLFHKPLTNKSQILVNHIIRYIKTTTSLVTMFCNDYYFCHYCSGIFGRGKLKEEVYLGSQWEGGENQWPSLFISWYRELDAEAQFSSVFLHKQKKN